MTQSAERADHHPIDDTQVVMVIRNAEKPNSSPSPAIPYPIADAPTAG